MRVKKAELARMLGLSRARVTQLVAKGLPVDAAGAVDVEEARRWIAENVDPGRRVGWHEARGRRREEAPTSLSSSPADPYGPAHRFDQPGQRGLALAALGVLYHAPAVVVHAVAEAGGSRELATRAAELAVAGMWEILEDFARTWHLPEGPDGTILQADEATLLGWSQRVPWDELFGAGDAQPRGAGAPVVNGSALPSAGPPA